MQLLLLVLAVVTLTGSGMTSVVFPEEMEEAECLPLHRCCHLARIWRERHQRQVEAEDEAQDQSSGPLYDNFLVLATLSKLLGKGSKTPVTETFRPRKFLNGKRGTPCPPLKLRLYR